MTKKGGGAGLSLSAQPGFLSAEGCPPLPLPTRRAHPSATAVEAEMSVQAGADTTAEDVSSASRGLSADEAALLEQLKAVKGGAGRKGAKKKKGGKKRR